MKQHSLIEKISAVKESLNFDSTNEAADCLGISKSTLYSWVDEFGDYVTDAKYKNIKEIADAVARAPQSRTRPPRAFTYPDTLKGDTFIERLRYMKQESGITQREIGEAIGMTASGVAQMFATGSTPRKKTLRKLVEAFKYTEDEWMGRNKKAPQVPPELSDIVIKRVEEEPAKPEPTPPPQVATIISEPVMQNKSVDEIKEVKKLKKEIEELSERIDKMQEAQLNMINTITSCMQTQQAMLQFQQTQRIFIPNRKKDDSSIFNSRDYQAKLGDLFPDSSGNR